MTANQIAYSNYVESHRSNRANEIETHRANLAREEENHRANKVSEAQRWSQLTQDRYKADQSFTASKYASRLNYLAAINSARRAIQSARIAADTQIVTAHEGNLYSSLISEARNRSSERIAEAQRANQLELQRLENDARLRVTYAQGKQQSAIQSQRDSQANYRQERELTQRYWQMGLNAAAGVIKSAPYIIKMFGGI